MNAEVEQVEGNEIKKVHTACLDCIFSKWEGNTQTGCELGLTDLYKEKDMLVEAYDKNGEFFVVNGRRCRGYMTYKSSLNRLPMAERVDFMKDWLSVKVDAVLLINDSFHESDLKRTISSLKSQSHPIQTLYIVSTVCEMKAYAHFTNQMRGLVGELQWVVVFPQELDGSVSEGAAIDEVVRKMNKKNNNDDGKKVRTDFYLVIKPGQTIPANFVEEVDYAINHEFEQFVFVDGETPLYHVKTHQHPFIQGNTEFDVGEDDEKIRLTSLAEKIRYFAKEQGQESMVKNAY